MRLRLRELLHERHMTPYAVAQASNHRLDASTLYRLMRKDGRVAMYKAELLDALCDVLGVGPGDLLQHEPAKRRR